MTGYQVDQFFHGNWPSAGFSWVVLDENGDLCGGPDRRGVHAQSFPTRADAEHAARHLDLRGALR